MLKFIKGHMATIADIELFPIISLLIFFFFFVGMIIYTMRLKKSATAELSQMPLEDGTDPSLIQSFSNHE